MEHRSLQAGAALLYGASLVLVVFLVTGGTTPVHADPGLLYVAPEGNCNEASPCFESIQAAVDAATSGDEILVAAGTYTATQVRPAPGGYKGPDTVTQTLYIAKTVTVRGGYDAAYTEPPDPEVNLTILDPQGNGRGVFIAGSISPVVDGFRITGGDATGLGGSDWTPMGDWDIRGAGGGVYIVTATATIRNCDIYNNSVPSGGFGGGVYLNRAGATLTGNAIRENTAWYYGSGGGVAVWFSNATLDRNIIRQNRNSGIYVYGHTPTFSNNTITDNFSEWDGGGVQLYYGGALFSGNVITGNSAGTNGGGVSLYTYSGARFDGEIISGNVASQGSGLHVSSHSNAYLTNTVIADNEATGVSGAGLHVEDRSSLRLVHGTVARNVGSSGILISLEEAATGNSVAITNTTLVGHSVGISVTDFNTVTVNGILWYDTPITVSQTALATVSVQNEYMGAPAFAEDGSHLLISSTAIDKGVDAGVYNDIDGQARPFGTGPDLGADEWATVETTAEPAAPSIITATVGGVTTTIVIPSGAVTETTTLRYTALATTTQSSPSGLFFAHRTFDLDVYSGETLLPGYVFSTPVTVTLHYADGDVAGLDEGTLVLEYWDEDTGTWEDAACDVYDRHPDENWLAAPICHLSRFALFGEVHTVYLPLVLRNH
jgi:parallel beta-helix repeat protein